MSLDDSGPLASLSLQDAFPPARPQLSHTTTQPSPDTTDSAPLPAPALLLGPAPTPLSETWHPEPETWPTTPPNTGTAFSTFSTTLFTTPSSLALPNLPTTTVDTLLLPATNLSLSLGNYDHSSHTLLSFPSDDATRLLAETSLTWNLPSSRLPGRLTLGAFYESGDLATPSGAARTGSSWGPYLVLDQQLWRANPANPRDPRGVGLFLIYDHANADLFPVTDHLAAGLSLLGPLPDRPADTLGLGLSYAHLASDPAATLSTNAQTALETFYQFRLSPHLTLRPNLQYILDPATPSDSHALVASIRLELSF
jgi:carbohydrate-selective porin OprB